MQKRKASETARLTTLMRAAHQILDADPKILFDPVAVGLVPGSSEPEIREREEVFQQPRRRWTRSQIVLRSRFAEDQLCEAVQDGVRQYILLGAGFDTFAYRQPAWASELSIVEADHPASQESKQECLSKAGLRPPNNVSFCPIDFEHTSLAEGLVLSAFDPQAPAFVSWLGVTAYLTRFAIEKTLQFVLSLPSRSRLVFTFMLPISSLHGLDREAMELSTAIAAERGEPFISCFETDEMCEWLYGLSFSRVFHLSPEQAQERYFADRTDGLFAPSGAQIMCAHV